MNVLPLFPLHANIVLNMVLILDDLLEYFLPCYRKWQADFFKAYVYIDTLSECIFMSLSDVDVHSCAICFVDGDVFVRPQWSLQRMEQLTAVADNVLDVRERLNFPGCRWTC